MRGSQVSPWGVMGGGDAVKPELEEMTLARVLWHPAWGDRKLFSY